ncbi:gpi-anchored protein [Moniliophthora roreri MCA 2997]|uniref:Gpi-anchored protein n=1 Tax=Moniliophthora roreri (strain MCA 2997) TaxID=1381753 RepID=V2Y7I8_MONRO|nr:gpi-anchored protein [Moniliophthora roreri MCA 2997]
MYRVRLIHLSDVLKNGHDDKLFKTYFGTAQPYPVLGANEQLISGNKTGILFRCDNIDGNCGQEGWYGHWRRKPLEQFCALGYTVTNSSPSYYFAADLMHRFYHIPTIGNGIIGHYADSYEECLQLAIDHPENATYNTHSLQYFAADVYARVIGNPGEGCTGNFTLHLNTMGSTSTGDSKTYSGETTHNDKTTSNSNGQHCHTHANGEVHCD